MKVSVQLHSLRDDIERVGLEVALREVKSAGFDGVETAGFYGLEPIEFKAILDKIGLEVSGMHIGLEDILNTSIVEKTTEVGFKNVIVPHISFKEFKENFNTVAEKMKKAMEICVKNKVSLSYHNHAHEFYCGGDFNKRLLDSVEGLLFELDIFWLAVGGRRFDEYYNSVKDRILTFHIKELSGDGPGSFSEVVGKGNAFCKEARDTAKSAGFEWLTLEFEKIDMPFEKYLQESAAFLKA